MREYEVADLVGPGKRAKIEKSIKFNLDKLTENNDVFLQAKLIFKPRNSSANELQTKQLIFPLNANVKVFPQPYINPSVSCKEGIKKCFLEINPRNVGVIKKVKEDNITIPKLENFNAITGKGVEANVEGKQIKVVSPGYLKDEKITIPEDAYSDAAETVVFVLIDGQLAGYIALADEIRPESAEAIKIFKKNNIKVLMATGDNEITAKAVSDKLGLDGYYAEVLPHQKVEIVKELQVKGEFVAMTGDGVNDAPALAQANVGIAVGSGTDVAAETADIILVNSNPQDIANLILFGKATYNKMIQNLIWATGYNIVAIPLAAGVLYSSGFVLGPAVGAVFMSLSTVIVAINAQLLKRKIGKK